MNFPLSSYRTLFRSIFFRTFPSSTSSLSLIRARKATLVSWGAILLLGVAGLSGISAQAQTTAAASLYGSFSGTTSANSTVQSPSSSAGMLLELRHTSNPLVGYELNYSFNDANQKYNLQSVKAHAHEVGADWVVSLPIANFRPFVLAGGGLVFFGTNGDQTNVSGETKPVFVYGAGLDWTVIPHLGLRFQYRGNLYHAPDLSTTASATHEVTQAAQPMIGAYFRF
jgi:opacity protein-like surface antigen